MAIFLLTVHITNVEQGAKDGVEFTLAEHASIPQRLQVATADLLHGLDVAALGDLQNGGRDGRKRPSGMSTEDKIESCRTKLENQ